ncbi:MAG: hypothetical protein EPN26_10905 [Rhodospirillales bacterium]|nr:MAG: hypothetical protein EPN26_10905 [Rhodospirillales bacterium]
MSDVLAQLRDAVAECAVRGKTPHLIRVGPGLFNELKDKYWIAQRPPDEDGVVADLWFYQDIPVEPDPTLDPRAFRMTVL